MDKIQLSRIQVVFILLLFIVVVVIVGLLAGLLSSNCKSTGTRINGETTATDRTPWLDHRLPWYTLPLHYDLRLFPDFYDNHTHFYGNVTVVINITKDTHHLLLHHKKMNITSTKLINASTKSPLEIKQTFPYPKNEYWVVETLAHIPSGSTVEVTIGFDGSLTNGIMGLYRSTYVNSETGERRYLATSKFQPTEARKAFPCLDEPGLKSTFTITLVHRPEYTALSNMPALVTRPVPGSSALVETTFEKSVPMVTYLACFIVCDFLSLDGMTKTGVPFRVFATPDRIKQAEYALDFGIKAQDYFEEYFGVPYPLPKMDMVAIPDFVSGAMEHWGLITYRETNMLYDPNEASAEDKQRVASVIAHEIAHMWFGNLVTMAWWDDLWLNEGFASYMEYKAIQQIHPEWDVADQFLVQDLAISFELDAAVTSHPIVVPVSHPDQINEVFDSISYSKGASIIRMLEAFMGSDNFRQGITKYIQAFEFETTVTDDLWRYLTQVTGSPDIKAIMDTWTRQMGYPVIHIEYNKQSVTLTQSRFLLDPHGNIWEPPSDFNYIWKVPVTFMTSTGESGQFWMHQRQESFELPPTVDPSKDWIKYNLNMTGFYCVNYPISSWQRFGHLLEENPQLMSPSDRTSLIVDLFALADSGKRTYDITLDMVLRSMNKEEHYVPWRVFRNNLKYIGNMLMSSVHFGKWLKFTQNLVSPKLQRIGLEEKGNHMEKLLRVTLMALACGSNDPWTMANVTNMFHRWIEDPVGNRIPTSMRSVVYVNGMAESGDEAEWNHVWEMYQMAVVPQEKRRLLQALTQTKRIWLLARLLSYSMDESKVRRQDFFSLIIYMSRNDVARPIVWDWIRSQWPALVDRFGLENRYLGRLVPSVVSSFNTEFHLEQLTEFWKKYPDGGAGERGRSQALEIIKTNIAWMKSNAGIIGKWLDKNFE